MNLLEARQRQIKKANHSILIYGPPKSGKTFLVGTAAKIPKIRRIFWFDLENGIETILSAGYSDAELAKITLFKIADTKEQPRAIETMLKAMTSRTPVMICDAHGVVDCIECAKIKASSTPFCLSQCTHEDLVVIDSGSQLGSSALNFTCLGKPLLYKPLLDDYGNMGKWLTDILLTVQQCEYTNIVMITQELSEKGEDGVERLYPLVGTRNYSTAVSKYFGTVVYANVSLKKHVYGSSSTYKANTVTGSRLNVQLEKAVNPSMESILIEGGIL